jgi:hypothetical protein
LDSHSLEKKEKKAKLSDLAKRNFKVAKNK